jgi:hypothetical protein
MATPASLLDRGTLHRLYVKQEMPLAHVAREVGASRATVIRRLIRYDIPIAETSHSHLKRKCTLTPGQLADEWSKAGTIRALATALGTSTVTASRWLVEAGIDTTRSPAVRQRAEASRRAAEAKRAAAAAYRALEDAHEAARIEHTVILYSEGLTTAKIAKRMGLGEQAVSGLLHAAHVVRRRPTPPPQGPVLYQCATGCGARVRRRNRVCLPCSAQRRRVSGSSEGLVATNQTRSSTASARDVQQARDALERGVSNVRWVQVLQARVKYPTASLAELATELGWTKDMTSTTLRRALKSPRQ